MGKENVRNLLLQCVIKVSHTTLEALSDRERSARIDNIRGVYYLIGREMGIHPHIIAEPLNRSRSVCITVSKKYRGYLEVGDKQVCELYKKIKEALNGGN